MDSKITIEIEELIDRLNQMKEDGFVTAELTIVDTDYIDDTTLALRAIDISQSGNIDYGELQSISDELF